MTSGYYDGLKKTVHQRFDFRVVMSEGDTREIVQAVDIERFTARYLNATRLNASELESWYKRSREQHDGTSEPVPSACGTCRHRKPCHHAFGAHEGMGLYPLNPTAIGNITRRVSPGGFNPRTQLKEGYQPILANYADALRTGRFPPPELLARLGGSTLRATVDSELIRRDSVDYARRGVLLDLWTSSNAVVGNLDLVIHQAFDLPPLSDAAATPVEAAPTTKPREAATTAPTRRQSNPKLDSQVLELDQWKSGGALSQDTTQTLRELVFEAVATHIDWNAQHLIQGEFAGNTKVFNQARSINFRNQFLSEQRATIQLRIPLREDDFVNATLALQGLILFQHHRSWQFPDGTTHYRAYLRQVDLWSLHVLDQVNSVTESRDQWDPVPASIELLAISARILGRPRLRHPEVADYVDAFLAKPSDKDESERSKPWQELAKTALAHSEKLKGLVLSRVGCAKGRARRSQIIDAAHVLPSLADVRRTWRPTQTIPADLIKQVRFVSDCRDTFAELLDAATAAEREFQLERYGQVAHQLGAEGEQPDVVAAKRKTTADALRKALHAAVQANILSGVNKADFEEKLQKFEGFQIQQWAESAQRLSAESDPARLLAELSLVPGGAARTANDLLESADRMLSRTNEVIDQELRDHTDGAAEELFATEQAITDDLAAIDNALASLGNGQ
jgi:hypothetical protein